MNRVHGIGVALIGLVIVILSAVGILPLMSTGSSVIFLGLLLFGLSFIKKPETDDTARMSTPETLGAIFYAPTEVFQNLRRHPRWLVVVLLTSLVAAVYSNLFYYQITPERIVNYTIDKTKQMSFLNDDARAKIEEGRPKAIEQEKNPIARAGKAVNGFVGQVFMVAFLGFVFWLFTLVMGGQMNFWQAFSSTAYALFPVSVIRYVLSIIILFIKDKDDIHPILGQNGLVTDNLGALINPAQSPVLFVLLSSLGLLSFYWLWLNATGLKNAGERVTTTNAWSATLLIWIIGILLGVVMALFFPSFMS